MTICTNCDTGGKIYIGDIGTVLTVNVCEDISTATVTDLLIEKPDGTTETWSGTVYNSTYIRYTSQSGDFDQAGKYIFQAYIEMSGWSGRGTLDSFRVHNFFT